MKLLDQSNMSNIPGLEMDSQADKDLHVSVIVSAAPRVLRPSYNTIPVTIDKGNEANKTLNDYNFYNFGLK